VMQVVVMKVEAVNQVEKKVVPPWVRTGVEHGTKVVNVMVSVMVVVCPPLEPEPELPVGDGEVRVFPPPVPMGNDEGFELPGVVTVDVEIGVEETAVTKRRKCRKSPLIARVDPARADRQSMEKCMMIVRLISD